MSELTLAGAPDLVGRELALTGWVEVTQAMVDDFARATLDPDWMHVDVERSRRESPFGGTIAQGFLSLSLVIHFNHMAGLRPRDAAYALNYGVDRARFPSPVLVGARVRDRIVLAGFEPRGEGRFLMKTRHTIEVEGQEKPAAVVEYLTLWFRDLGY